MLSTADAHKTDRMNPNGLPRESPSTFWTALEIICMHKSTDPIEFTMKLVLMTWVYKRNDTKTSIFTHPVSTHTHTQTCIRIHTYTKGSRKHQLLQSHSTWQKFKEKLSHVQLIRANGSTDVETFHIFCYLQLWATDFPHLKLSLVCMYL